MPLWLLSFNVHVPYPSRSRAVGLLPTDVGLLWIVGMAGNRTGTAWRGRGDDRSAERWSGGRRARCAAGWRRAGGRVTRLELGERAGREVQRAAGSDASETRPSEKEEEGF